MSKHRFPCVEKRNWEKLTLTNCYTINFGLCAEKTWTFSKTVKHDSQNCSLRVQRKIFRNFSEATIIVWKFSVFEGKDRLSWLSCEKFYSGLPKAHFTCPEQHFEKKMIEVNFSVCGFFISLREFFFTNKKTGPVSKRQLRRTEQNLGKHFLSQMFFSKIFRYWAEEFGNFAENYIRVVKSTFNWSWGTLSQQHFWSKSVNISTFPDFYRSFHDCSEKLL